jgi:hypothetical protein
MPNYSLFFILPLVVTLMMACNSEQYNKAKSAYQEAKSAQQIKPLLKALTILAPLEPETYQNELDNVQSALAQLELAQRNMAQGDIVGAFLASDNSYRKMNNLEAKQLLVDSGKALGKLTQIQKLVLKSFEQRPDAISVALVTYGESSPESWQLVAFNQFIKELIDSIRILDTALSLLQNDPLLASAAKLRDWRQQIKFQSETLTQVKDYFISHCLKQSALVLTQLNDSLATDAKGLLSYVRPKMAKGAMIPLFSKAQKRYAPYLELMENLYLVVSKATGKKKIDWYLRWNQLEQQVLNSPHSFGHYPTQYESRVSGINRLLKDTEVKRPKIDPDTMRIDHFEQQNERVIDLIAKLKQDRAIINHSRAPYYDSHNDNYAR